MTKEETKEYIYNRDRSYCQVEGCKNPGTQLAHLIPQRKHLIKKYGSEVIHNASNMKLACCLDHNAKLQLHPWEWDNKAKEIQEMLKTD
jgi:hypothetical protein